MKTTIAAVACCLGLLLGMSACDTTFENPNAASEDQVLSTVGGLRALAIGMRREYSVTTLSSVIRTSGLSAREFGVVVGFTNPQEIELGGTALPAENGILTGLWSNNYRVMGMAEQLIDNAGIVGEPATSNAFLALGHFFKAMSLGNLAQFYEAMPISVDPDGDGAFVPRQEALQEAVRLLEAGIAALGGQGVPGDFQRLVLGTTDFDLNLSMNAYLARYQLFLGNHAAATAAANAALQNPSARSVFTYDSGNSNENPLYIQTTLEPATYKPVDNFGLDPAVFTVDPNDGRLAFYLSPSDAIGESSRIPVETMHGFFDVINEPIPVYLPGEMYLIRAEAAARTNDLPGAIAALNQVLQKTNDPYGVNANLPAYSGAQTQDAVLQEIFRNRRLELFLTGLSLEDSRRFGQPEPPNPASFDSFNRNRNFYPYPQTERDNNPNTPANPSI